MSALVRRLGAGLVAGLVLAGCGAAAPPPKPVFGTWGFDASAMDPTVRPGDDFYDYVLGDWVKTAQDDIRPDGLCTGIDLDIQDQLNANLTEIITSAADEDDATDGDASQLVGDLYKSFLDEDDINARGIEPVQPFLTAIDGITNHAQFSDVLVSFNEQHTSITDPFLLSMSIDRNDPSRYVYGMEQGGLTLGDRDYYVSQDPESVALRAKFVTHVERVLSLAGYPDARAQAEQLLALETKLAQVQWTSEQNRDVQATNNMMSRAQVEELAQGAPLGRMLDALGVPAETDMIVAQPDVLPQTARLYATEPVEAWKAYYRYQVLSAYGSYLSQPISDEMFDFYGRTLSGQQERRPRDERAVSFVNGQLSDAVGERYVAAHFAEQTKDDVLKLVSNLRSAYQARIRNADWMSPDTRLEAQAKLASIVAKIGYPNKWEPYDGLTIVPDDLFANIRSMEQWGSAEQVKRFSEPIDRTEWGMSPQTNNAYYSARFNDIVFPAAILQPPYFDPAADPAANYGAIGATIGHEMSHGFDDQGRRSDANGVQRDWWTAADDERYQERADELVAQFDAYEPLPGLNINGELTLGENIADLAGLRIAYDAYKLSSQGREAPVIEGLTGDQRFFTAYAASWKNLCRPETLRNQLLSDPHSPSEYRVNGIVRNMDEWYEAFDVKEGDALYLPPDQRVRIW